MPIKPLRTRLKIEPVRRPEALRQPLWPIWILDHSSGLPAGGPQQIFGSAFLEWHLQLAAAMPRPVSPLSPLALTTHAHKGIAFPSLRHCSKRAYIISGLNCEPDDRDRERGHRGVRRGRAQAAALGAGAIPPRGWRVHIFSLNEKGPMTFNSFNMGSCFYCSAILKYVKK